MDIIDKKSSSKTIARALEVLEFISSNPKATSVIELSNSLGINRTTLYATLNTLNEMDYIDKDEDTGRYSIGYKAYEIGLFYTLRRPFIKMAEIFSGNIREKFNLECMIGIPRKPYSVLILNYDPIEINLKENLMGSPVLIMPLYASAIGKVFLGEMTEKILTDTIDNIELIPYTDTTITSKLLLLEEISSVKKNGYAFSKCEYINASYAIAAPIRDHAGKIIAGMSLSTHDEEIFEANVDEIIKEVKAITNRISLNLGWRR